MKKFHSVTTGGFYSEDIHGARRITVIDPAWVRPEIDGEPDMSAVPDMIEVDNPASTIPSDAVELTDAEYADFLEGLSLHKVIVYDENNRPVLHDKPLPSLDDIRVNMLAPAWAIRRAMSQQGLRTIVEAAIAVADDDTKDMWEYAVNFKRLHPMVVSLGAALGKTELEIDALFDLANTLS